MRKLEDIVELETRPASIGEIGFDVTPAEALHWLRCFERYRLRFPIFNAVHLGFHIDISGRGIIIDIESTAPDRATGNLVAVRNAKLVSFIQCRNMRDPEPFIAHVIRDTLREFLMHELDEMLMHDGVQLRDPHVTR